MSDWICGCDPDAEFKQSLIPERRWDWTIWTTQDPSPLQEARSCLQLMYVRWLIMFWASWEFLELKFSTFCLLHNVGMALDYSSSSVAVRMLGHGISPMRRAFFTSKWVLTLLGRRNRCDEPFCWRNGKPFLLLLLWCSNRSHVLPWFGFLCSHHPIAHATKLEREPLLQQSKSKGSIFRVRETIVTAAKSKASICREKREAPLLQQIKGFNLRRERETDILAAANQKVNLQSEGNNCCCSKIKWFNLQRERDRHTSWSKPKSFNLQRKKHTHTHTYILAAAKQSLQSAEEERNSCLLLQQQIKASICGDQHSIAMKRARSSLPFGDWMKYCGATHLPPCRLQQQSDKICGLSPLPTSPSLLLPCSLSYFYSWKMWGSFSASCWRQRWSFLSTSETLTILRYIENRENRNGDDDDPNGKCVCFRSSFCRESSTHLRQLQLQFEGSSQGLQLGFENKSWFQNWLLQGWWWP